MMAHRLWRLIQTLCAGQLVLMLILAASCRGSALTPQQPGGSNSPFQATIPTGLMIEDASPEGITGQGVLGAFKFTLDPATETATLEPVARTSGALGDPYTADITGFLSGNPCLDCFRLEGVGLTPEKYVYADYSIRHPFPLPQNVPPGFNDRLDLHVYDVRGVFMKADPDDPRGVHTFAGLQPVGGGGSQADELVIDNSGFLASATLDGMTGSLDAYTDTFFPTLATAHPYILMREDVRPTNFDPSHPNGWTDLYAPMGHNVLPQGSGPFTRRVIFTAQPGQPVEYLIVLAANFASPATGPGQALGKRANPVYYLPWANQKSPWRVRVSEHTNNLTSNKAESEARLHVEVYDWQHQVGVMTLTDQFRTENQARNSLLRPSRVLGIEGAVPGISPMDSVNSGFLAGIGSPTDPLVYEVIIPNVEAAGTGTYLGALRIKDEYESPPGALEGVGRNLNPFRVEDFSTYVTFSLAVLPGEGGELGFGSNGAVYNNPVPQPQVNEAVTLDEGTAANLAIYNQVAPPAEFLFGVVEASNFGNQPIPQMVAICQSGNGGTSFGTAQLAPALGGGTMQASPEIIAVNDSFIPGVVWLHLVYASNELGSGSGFDVYYTRSSNLGTTWSAPVRVHAEAGGQQTRPHLATNPFNSNDLIVVMEESRGGSRIRACRDSDGDGLFELETVLDNSSGVGASSRSHPHIAYAPAPAGQPNTFAVTWARRNEGGADIRAAFTETGWGGLGSTILPVSDEEDTNQVSVHPNGIFVLSPFGADYVVAYNTQTLQTFMSPGNQPVTQVVANRVFSASKPGNSGVFSAPQKISDTDDITQAGQPVLVRMGETMGAPVAAVWNDNRNRYSSGHDIFIAFTNNQGASWGFDVLAVSDPGHQRFPSLVVNPSGGLRLMYRDENRPVRQMIRLVQGQLP